MMDNDNNKDDDKNIDEDINKDLDKEQDEDLDLEDIRYTSQYSSEKFWEKICKLGKKIGLKSIYFSLILYYVMEKKDLPKKDKLLIMGALGYLILPLDLIPDFIPFGGFADDGFALLLALRKVSKYIDEEVKEKAYLKISNWFKISREELKQYI